MWSKCRVSSAYQVFTAPILPMGRGRTTCLMLDLPHTCSICAGLWRHWPLGFLERKQLLQLPLEIPLHHRGQNSRPAGLLKPRGSCPCEFECGRAIRVPQHVVSQPLTPSHSRTAQTLLAPALELTRKATRCEPGNGVSLSPQRQNARRTFTAGVSEAGPCSYISLPTKVDALPVCHQPSPRCTPLGSISEVALLSSGASFVNNLPFLFS